ncbi:MAG: hypothetical protein ACLT2I_03800, partial [Corynebacterium variabile]
MAPIVTASTVAMATPVLTGLAVLPELRLVGPAVATSTSTESVVGDAVRPSVWSTVWSAMGPAVRVRTAVGSAVRT